MHRPSEFSWRRRLNIWCYIKSILMLVPCPRTPHARDPVLLVPYIPRVCLGVIKPALSVLPTGVLVWPQGSRKLVCCSVKPSQDTELVRLSPGGRTGLWTSPANVGKRASTIRLEEPSHTHMHTHRHRRTASTSSRANLQYERVLYWGVNHPSVIQPCSALEFKRGARICGVKTQLYTHTLTCILTHTLSNLCECVCLSWQRSGVRTSRHVREFTMCVC